MFSTLISIPAALLCIIIDIMRKSLVILAIPVESDNQYYSPAFTRLLENTFWPVSPLFEADGKIGIKNWGKKRTQFEILKQARHILEKCTNLTRAKCSLGRRGSFKLVSVYAYKTSLTLLLTVIYLSH